MHSGHFIVDDKLELLPLSTVASIMEISQFGRLLLSTRLSCLSSLIEQQDSVQGGHAGDTHSFCEEWNSKHWNQVT